MVNAPDTPTRPDDLSAFRWHTGAPVRPLAPGESCPVLFRDVGPAALALFLRRRLPRLAGPLSPITYLRTADFAEPYTDHESTGRLVVLRPAGVWHSGVAHVYIARARPGVDHTAVGFVPGGVDLAEVARLIDGAGDTAELREALGGRAYDNATADQLDRLDRLADELAAAERGVAPLRAAFRSADVRRRAEARAALARAGITESDLCTAWHHLPRERRVFVAEAAGSITLPEGTPW